MRLEATAKQDEYKVWMTDGELNPLRRAAASTATTSSFSWAAMLDFVRLRFHRFDQKT